MTHSSSHSLRSEPALLGAARDGDEQAFRALTEPYLRELHVHCYRMLGSPHDADDALQDVLLRAWRHLDGFQARSSIRSWLYAVATNVCLTAAGRRRRLPEVAGLPGESPEADGELIPIGPYPDSLLDRVEPGWQNPAARYDLRESVQLAFLVAIQLLPPRQRAVLILRDVLGWSAREVADLVGSSVAGVNSALQRARATLDARRKEGLLRAAIPPAGDVERSLLDRYLEAWEAVDVDALVALLKEDAVLTMPPFPLRLVGREPIAGFLRTVPAGGALDEIRLERTRANGDPALAAYVLDREDGLYHGYGIMVFTLEGEAIAEITGFADASLFELFGLPSTLPPSP